MSTLIRLWVLITITVTLLYQHCEAKRLNEVDVPFYREKVKKMFYHAYDSYLKYAYPYDELQPLTCKGFDTWGSYSLTLIDAMDTLAVIGNNSEFRRIANIVIDKGEAIFDMDINVSVFETNIRIVGGLLSAHLLMKRTGMELEPAWPCSGPLLRMAEGIARRLLPAFDTPTGMPYGTVNLRSGVPKGETTVTCTAGVGTFIIEFGTLSRLTGDPIFEKTAIRAIRSLWKFRSPIGLLGNHIDVKTGKWTALDSGIGGGVDSYFEYLVKGSILFNLPELVYLFRDFEQPIKKYLKRDDWYMWAHMNKGSITLPMFTSLDAFWPGIQALLGDIEPAMKTLHNFQQVWHQFGATPEYYNIPKAEAHKGREGYPLRPELIESIVYLYQATKDPVLLEMAVEIVEAIERIAKTSCGYATVKDVQDHRLEDRMESFFLAETAKYLYLLFDTDNFIHNNGSHGTHINTPSGSCVIEAGGYVFNTEAHPIDLAAIYCCSAEKQEEDRKLEAFHSNLDLLTLTGLVEDVSEIGDVNWQNGRRKQKGPRWSADSLEEDDDEGGEEGEEEEEKEGKILEEGKRPFTIEEAEMGKALFSPEHFDEVITIKEVIIEGTENSDEKTRVADDGAEHAIVSESISEGDGTETPIEMIEKTDNIWDEKDTHLNAEKNKYLEPSQNLHSIDLTGLSDIEKDLAHIFLEQLHVDSDIADVSLKIGQKMGSDFKGTELEHVAEIISKQLMQVRNVRLDGLKESTLENARRDSETGSSGKGDEDDNVNETENDEKKDTTKDTENNEVGSGFKHSEDIPSKQEDAINGRGKDEANENSGESENRSESVPEKTGKNGASESKTDPKMVILPEGILAKDNTNNKESIGSNAQKGSDQSMTTEVKDQQQVATLDPKLQRLKDHLEAQLLQQYRLSNLKEDAQREEHVASLETKRANILSLTTKLFQLFARGFTGGGGGAEDDDESSKILKPSLGGLYKSLAGYPLRYFHDPQMMHCPAQSFHSRISVYGEMFEE